MHQSDSRHRPACILNVARDVVVAAAGGALIAQITGSLPMMLLGAGLAGALQAAAASSSPTQRRPTSPEGTSGHG